MPTVVAWVRQSSVSVFPHDKTKTAETTITKLATGTIHHESSWMSNHGTLGQNVKDKVSESQTTKNTKADAVCWHQFVVFVCKIKTKTSPNLAQGQFMTSPCPPITIRSKVKVRFRVMVRQSSGLHELFIYRVTLVVWLSLILSRKQTASPKDHQKHQQGQQT